MRALATILGFLVFLAGPLGAAAKPLPLDSIQLPPGFKIRLYAKDVPGARTMALSPDGTLFIGTREQGNVYAVVDQDKDNVADQVVTVARKLFMPNCVAFREGALYVAEVHRVLRFDGIEKRLKKPPNPVVVNAAFPKSRYHGAKLIRFGPDGLLYVPVGAPCNACKKKDPRFAGLLRMRPDGSGLEVFASGIRNAAGFDWQPETGALWFTDNCRDWLGKGLPPDELNCAPDKGLHFGFPHCHGKDIDDPKFGKKGLCGQYVPPALELGPNVEALGMRFYTGTMFPERYRRQIFIAEHGSWNNSAPAGYRIILARVEKNRATAYETFAQGWLRAKKPWGRPADVLVMPDGALLVSDDKAGAVYRIDYGMEPAQP